MKRLVWILALAMVSVSGVALAGGPCGHLGYGVSGVYNPGAAIPTPTGGPLSLSRVTNAVVPAEVMSQSNVVTGHARTAVRTVLPTGGRALIGGVARGLTSAFTPG